MRTLTKGRTGGADSAPRTRCLTELQMAGLGCLGALKRPAAELLGYLAVRNKQIRRLAGDVDELHADGS